jgi:hypothetical protein
VGSSPFCGWVKAFPTWTERAQKVVCTLLKEIIPRYGIPISIGLDNRPSFVAAVVKQLTKGLKITWNLHTAHQPQSSGKVERINCTLKTQMSKFCQETHLTWEQILPLDWLSIRCSPTKQISPYEIVFGSPLLLVKGIKGDLKEIGNLTLLQQMHSLGEVLNDLHRHVREKLPISLTTDVHSFKTGDQVWIKEWNLQPLQPWWRGPYSVILITTTVIKMVEITPWIHHIQVNKAAPEWKSELDSNNPLKLTLRRGSSALP